jgi:hypothetical protein
MDLQREGPPLRKPNLGFLVTKVLTHAQNKQMIEENSRIHPRVSDARSVLVSGLLPHAFPADGPRRASACAIERIKILFIRIAN